MTTGKVVIDIISQSVEDKTLYTWSLSIDGSEFEEKDEFYYASELDALKKAQKRLYAWIKQQESE